MKDEYSTDELKFFDKITEDLIIWLFDSTDKRHAILHQIKLAYDKGKESSIKPNKKIPQPKGVFSGTYE